MSRPLPQLRFNGALAALLLFAPMPDASAAVEAAAVWAWPVLGAVGIAAGILAFLMLRRRRVRGLAESAWSQALEFADEAIYLIDLDDHLVRGNQAFFRYIGRRPQEALGRDIMQLVHGRHEDVPCAVCQARLERRDAVFVKEAGDPGNRIGRPIEIIVRIIRDEAERPLGVLQVLRDLTRQREAESALRQEKERLMVTLNSIGEAVIVTDSGGAVQYLNPVAEKLTGWSDGDARSRKLGELFTLVDEGTGNPVEDVVEQCLKKGSVVRSMSNGLLRRPDGREFAVDHTAGPIHDGEGRAVGVVLALRDVTEMRHLARQLTYQASHDGLTGLINRQEFEHRLERALQSAADEGRQHALCYLDLDQFKIVNDTCGHVAGDEMLKQIAALIKPRMRGRDSFARLGGDEFGVLLEDCPLPRALEIADAIRRAVAQFRFIWQGRTFEVGVSIGVTSITAASGSVTETLTAADTACYIAKERGRDRIHAFEPDEPTLNRRQTDREWAQRLARAVKEETLQLYAQPIVPLRAREAFARVEVLVRMADLDADVVSPMAFIPAAERHGLMPVLDRWVISRTLKLLSAPGVRADVACSINLSGRSLTEPGFLEFVVEAIRQAKVPHDRLTFEITETAAVANFAQAKQFIDELKLLGCRFALDDFGSGLSSFAYLKNLPVDYLKIDGNFVRDVAEDPIDRAMVESINQLGHVMGIATVAEYVESEPVLAELKAIGVDYAQGSAVGEPVRFERLLAEARAETDQANGVA